MRVLISEPREGVFEAIRSALGRNKIRCDALNPGDVDAVVADENGAEASSVAILIGDIDNRAEYIERLRSRGFDGPILALLDMKSSEETVGLLRAGADDVIVKPVNPSEIEARVAAIRRRSHGHASSRLTIGRLTIYFDGRDPEVDGRRLKLSHREHAIFTHLALQAGKVVSKNSVYDAVYGMMDSQPFDKVIDVYICKLRKKIAKATDGEQYIETVYGRGYKLDEPTVDTDALAEDDVAA